MQIRIKCLDRHGNYIGTLTGQALPRYPRLPAPEEFSVQLAEDDFKRLQRAFLRFTRAVEARQNVGSISTSLTGAEIVATKVAKHTEVKVLALEMRPFFLEKDPLSFTKLLSLQSIGKVESLRPCLKRHKLRWINSAFEGRMTIEVNDKTLDTSAVVRAWFNDDFFHSESDRAGELALGELISTMGGEEQAITLLTHHMIESLRVIGEFFNDIYQTSPEFSGWVATVPGWAQA